MNSDRLIFKRFREGDFADYFKLVGNEEVMKMISGKAMKKEEARDKFNMILHISNLNPDTGYFAINSKANKSFIGLAKIVMTGEAEAEIGYSLLPENWNRGYGSEISAKLVEHACSLLYIKSLIAIIDPENEASKRILAKSNFKLDKVCELDNLPAEIYRLMLDRQAKTCP